MRTSLVSTSNDICHTSNVYLPFSGSVIINSVPPAKRTVNKFFFQKNFLSSKLKNRKKLSTHRYLLSKSFYKTMTTILLTILWIILWTILSTIPSTALSSILSTSLSTILSTIPSTAISTILSIALLATFSKALDSFFGWLVRNTYFVHIFVSKI